MNKKSNLIIIILLIFISIFIFKINDNLTTIAENKTVAKEKKKRINYNELYYSSYFNNQIIGYIYDERNQELINYSTTLTIAGIDENTTNVEVYISLSILSGFGSGIEPDINTLYNRDFYFNRTINTNIININYIDIDYQLTFLTNNDTLQISSDNNRFNFSCNIYIENQEINGQSWQFNYTPSLLGQYASIFATEVSQNISLNENLNAVINEIKTNSYNQGMSDAENMEFNFEWLSAIFDSLNDILNVEIFPNFKIWYAVGVPLILALIYGVLKLFR